MSELEISGFDLSPNYLAPFGVELGGVDFGSSRFSDPAFFALLRRLVSRHKVVVIRDACVTDGDLLERFEPFGDVVWEGGIAGLYEVRNLEDDTFDKVMTSQQVPLHWDGFGSSWRADYQVFLCESTASSGGETLFSNTEAVYRSAVSLLGPDALGTTINYSTPTRYRQQFQGRDLRVDQPLVVPHRLTGVPTLRLVELPSEFIGDREIDGFAIAELAAPAAVELYRTLIAELYDSRHLYVHRWRPNDIVITDNNALLHGRNLFEGDRSLVRGLFNSREGLGASVAGGRVESGTGTGTGMGA